MPKYAGYKDLADYLRTQCQTRGWSLHEASRKLGAGNSYIRDAIAGRVWPSPERCDAIADLFNDSPHLVRILAGRDLPPAERDAVLDAILEIASRLTPADRNELLRYGRTLAESSDSQESNRSAKGRR